MSRLFALLLLIALSAAQTVPPEQECLDKFNAAGGTNSFVLRLSPCASGATPECCNTVKGIVGFNAPGGFGGCLCNQALYDMLLAQVPTIPLAQAVGATPAKVTDALQKCNVPFSAGTGGAACPAAGAAPAAAAPAAAAPAAAAPSAAAPAAAAPSAAAPAAAAPSAAAPTAAAPAAAAPAAAAPAAAEAPAAAAPAVTVAVGAPAAGAMPGMGIGQGAIIQAKLAKVMAAIQHKQKTAAYCIERAASRQARGGGTTLCGGLDPFGNGP